MLTTGRPLTLNCHPSLCSIFPGRSSGLTPRTEANICQNLPVGQLQHFHIWESYIYIYIYIYIYVCVCVCV